MIFQKMAWIIMDNYKDLYVKIKALDENESLTPFEKIQSINTKIFKDLDDRCFSKRSIILRLKKLNLKIDVGYRISSTLINVTYWSGF
jgi:hypothetical protein